MALTAHVYPQLDNGLGLKTVSLAADPLKVMLMASYVYADAHRYVSDVKAAGTEATGTGYTAGGLALTSVSWATNGKVSTLTCASPSWSNSTITASYAVFYDSVGGTDASNPVLCYWDFGGSQSSSASVFTLQVAAGGLITVTAS